MKIAIFVVFAVVVGTGCAIQCYTCTYVESTGIQADCKDGAVPSKYLKTCTLFPNCQKSVNTLAGKTIITRDCGFGITGCIAGSCSYSCNTDGCNGANSVKTSVLVIISTLGTALLLAPF